MKKALLIGLLLFGMNVQANPTTDPVETTEKTSMHCHHKAEYYAIKAELKDGKITLKEAQRKWFAFRNKLRKKEGAK